MTYAKICGLRTIEHALAAVEAGADLLGLIFAPSRRQVTPAQASAIARAVRDAAPAGRQVELVGVFVNAAPDHMREVARECDLDALQLSGDEPAAIADQLAGIGLIKTIRFNASVAEQDWLAYDWPHVRLHADAHVPGVYGGAGVVADWQKSFELARRRQLILAGGLTPANVGVAIEQVRPWAVDVSSGVETDGVKDVRKIRQFVAGAKAAN